MMIKKGIGIVLISLLAFNLTACGNTGSTSEPAPTQAETPKAQDEKKDQAEEQKGPQDFTTAVKTVVDELAKSSNGEKVDFALVEKTYIEKIKPAVEARDTEFNEQVSVQLDGALTAGKEGSLDTQIVKQVFDKLLQKVAFLSVRHELNEVGEHWDDKEKVKAEIEEAKQFYDPILKSTLEKRDTAYETQLVSAVEGAFSAMESATEVLDFQLAKQVVDKTMMKGFYLAAGASPNGYAYKIEKAVKEDPEHAGIAQAEGWAFYQSLHPYISKHASEEAEFINSQFDLTNDAAKIKADEINQAFIRGVAKVALDEYAESFESWGKDKSVITALEGALFIQMMEIDLKRVLGEEPTAQVIEKAGLLLEAVKSGDKEQAETLFKDVKNVLDQLSVLGK
ncbi:hypothetical protein J2Z37_003938 [Ammoniphilus resinae]|uniref:Lipoprotein n=2 Tax=Ammoniphilus resinae TaxID=861532 RepID=A0ABS4GUH8_9BACL|nr:hypothetical protein [Ammoniphilus resinae]